MEPISILAGTLGAAFLEEGIKFLWAEASKILERYHKARESKAPAEPVLDTPAPPALGFPPQRRFDLAAVERRKADLDKLVQSLALYGVGASTATLADKDVLRQADALHALLASLYGLPKVKLAVDSVVTIEENEQGAEATGVRARNIDEAEIHSDLDIGTNRGKAVGVDLTKD